MKIFLNHYVQLNYRKASIKAVKPGVNNSTLKSIRALLSEGI